MAVEKQCDGLCILVSDTSGMERDSGVEKSSSISVEEKPGMVENSDWLVGKSWFWKGLEVLPDEGGIEDRSAVAGSG